MQQTTHSQAPPPTRSTRRGGRRRVRVVTTYDDESADGSTQPPEWFVAGVATAAEFRNRRLSTPIAAEFRNRRLLSHHSTPIAAEFRNRRLLSHHSTVPTQTESVGTAALPPLVVTHSAGFFSCCSIRLHAIIDYYFRHGALPAVVDSTQQFRDYKVDPREDLTPHFWRPPTVDTPCVANTECWRMAMANNDPQFTDYRHLDLTQLTPLLRRYFSPSDAVLACVADLRQRYALRPDVTCGVRFRGNDKSTETVQPAYAELVEQALAVHARWPDTQFLVQTDEEEFWQYFSTQVRQRSAVLDRTGPPVRVFSMSEIPRLAVRDPTTSLMYTLPANDKLRATQYFVAAMLLLGECRHVVHTSGCGELWLALLRGHSRGLLQFLRHREELYGHPNARYRADQTTFWLRTVSELDDVAASVDGEGTH